MKTSTQKTACFLGIALIAAMVFSFASCKQDGGDDGDPSPFLGPTLTVSGEQVYTFDQDNVKFIEFDGNLTIADIGGVSGAIANGKLTFTIETPTSLEDISDSEFFYDNYNGYWGDTKCEPSDTKCFTLDLHITGSSEYNDVGKGNVSGTDNNGWEEDVFYIYVDRDVTITREGKTGIHIDDDDETETFWETKDFNLSLKKGWNAVCDRLSWKGTKDTETLSLGNPKNDKWIVSARGYYDDED